MAALDQALVIGGHTAKILIDGQDIGFFFDLTFSTEYGLQDVPVLGQTTVVEHQQTRFIVSWEARKYFIRQEVINPSQSTGLLPINAADALRRATFDLSILDNVSGQVIRTLESCTLANGSAGFSAGQLVSQRISGRAIDTRTSGQSHG
jgi:hypothetical protein